MGFKKKLFIRYLCVETRLIASLQLHHFKIHICNIFIIFDTMKRFNNKYRIPSARLPNYDYSSNGDYFITICTAGKMQYFGKIEAENVTLSEMGLIVERLIPNIAVQFQDIRIVEYIIMPDHIHFIIKIQKAIISDDDVETRLIFTDYDDVETRLIASLQPESIDKGGITGNNNPMFKNGIPKIIRWFKGRATFELRKINPEFAWQSRYYDRIIRNKNEYFAVIQYIKSNPEKWNRDL